MTMNVNAIDLIGENGFIMVDKGIAELVGIVPALIFGETVSTHLYWQNKGKLLEREGKKWFFCTLEDLEKKTTVKKDTQKKSFDILEKLGLLTTKLFGLPAKRYININELALKKFVDAYFKKKDNEETKAEKDVKKVNKDCHIQVAEKSETGVRKNRKQVYGKIGTNKKELNKKEFNNLSKERDMASPEINNPVVKKFMKENESNFASKNINIQDVYNWIIDNENKYSDKELLFGLNRLLNYHEPVFAPFHLLVNTFSEITKHMTLDKQRKEASKQRNKSNARKYMNNRNNRNNSNMNSRNKAMEASQPEWFDKHQQQTTEAYKRHEEAQQQETQSSPEDLAERRRKLQEELQATSRRKAI